MTQRIRNHLYTKVLQISLISDFNHIKLYCSCKNFHYHEVSENFWSYNIILYGFQEFSHVFVIPENRKEKKDKQ